MAGAGRRLLAVAVVTAMLGTGTAAAAPGASVAEPPLRLVAASGSVTLARWEGLPTLLLLGTYVVAGASPFEVWVERASYADPITARQIVRARGRQRRVPLPPGLVTEFSGGFPAFSHVTLSDASGAVVVDRDEPFCPNGRAVRTRPDAPGGSPYPPGPGGCPRNPFTLGSVWGIQAGWASPTTDEWFGEPVDLADGAYTAVVAVNQPYRELFGIPDGAASATVAVTVQPVFAEAATSGATRSRSGPALRPAAARPTGSASVPKGLKPDLRPLPAWGVFLSADDTGEYLSFNATVWTAGTSPLVVDGFRRLGTDLMDAYQYFYDRQGNQVGYAPAGTFEWDARPGHQHWHFTDFARYRLLDASRQVAVRHSKQAFCLANTDAVDYTLPSANWRPGNTDLHVDCGDPAALAIRQRLDTGSGDTYRQNLPGQSFTVSDLPNGTYYIEVAANPDGRLQETTTANNISLRKVILGGTPGERIIEVPPYQGIDA